jgi:hypothetical protein
MKIRAWAGIELLLLIAILAPPSSARGDGGAVRLRERSGNYLITIFTSPTPMRAGPVDISVLVQDAETGEWTPPSRVTVRIAAFNGEYSLEFPATAEAATNKLFRAAIFQLPAPGRWSVDVVIDGPRGPGQVGFEVVAADPLPPWLELWPWFVWPAVVIALFGIHQVLIRRKALQV